MEMEMKKIKMPKELADWYNEINRPPRFCFNCENFSRDGICLKFDLTPPPGFTETKDQCEHWEMAIPF
jgi:hypothetical protein